MVASILTPSELKTFLKYDRETGKLFWRERDGGPKWWNTRFSGGEAFSLDVVTGYVRGKIFNRSYVAHRVIWAMETGSWPTCEIDHKNRIRSDNSWRNLREATRAENSRNMKSRSETSSVFLGVNFDLKNNKWRANIYVNGMKKHLGLFEVEEDAAHAYDKAARKHHGEFANPNFAADGTVTRMVEADQ